MQQLEGLDSSNVKVSGISGGSNPAVAIKDPAVPRGRGTHRSVNRAAKLGSGSMSVHTAAAVNQRLEGETGTAVPAMQEDTRDTCRPSSSGDAPGEASDDTSVTGHSGTGHGQTPATASAPFATAQQHTEQARTHRRPSASSGESSEDEDEGATDSAPAVTRAAPHSAASGAISKGVVRHATSRSQRSAPKAHHSTDDGVPSLQLGVNMDNRTSQDGLQSEARSGDRAEACVPLQWHAEQLCKTKYCCVC